MIYKTIDATTIKPKHSRYSSKIHGIRDKSDSLEVGQGFYLGNVSQNEHTVIKVTLSKMGKKENKKFSIFKHEGRYLVKRVA